MAISYKTACAEEVKSPKQLAVPESIGNLALSVDNLFVRIRMLEDRLSPVRKIRPQEAEKDSAMLATGVLVADQIREVTERLKAMDMIVDVLLDELEV